LESLASQLPAGARLSPPYIRLAFPAANAFTDRSPFVALVQNEITVRFKTIGAYRRMDRKKQITQQNTVLETTIALGITIA
jgi:hypothetical protein